MASSYFDDIYLMRRMEILDRAQDLDASMKFDLATSPLSNGELDEINEAFNPKPVSQGWGFSDAFDQLLTREPEKVETDDIATLQSRLKEQGYLDPDYEVTGTWDPSSQAAFRQFDRDNQDKVNSGQHGLAATVMEGVELLGNTLPSRVFQGIIGTAKGLVDQTQETFERGGAGGGAVVGAGIGAAAGSVVPVVGTGLGALVGGGIGAAAGFFSSLFSDDDEDDTNKSFMDALHPFNDGEWTNPKNFWEDVGYVASAASLIRGGGMAVAGARTAPAAIQQGLGTLGPIAQPGYIARIVASTKGGAALGGIAGGARGLATGGDFGDIAEQAAIGSVIGAGVSKVAGGQIYRGAARFGFNRLVTNPLLQSVNKTYTGLSVANIGGRYAGGIGSGDDTTSIEQAIKEAPKLPDWVDYTAGMVLFPERLFPVSLGEAGSVFGKALGNVDAVPYVHALQTRDPVTGKVMSTAKAREWVKQTITPERDVYLRVQYGIYRKTNEMMQQYGPDLALTRSDGEKLYTEARSQIVRGIHEGTEAERATHIQDLLSYSYSNPLDDTKGPMAFASYLKRNDVGGAGLEKLPGFADSVRLTERLTQEARDGTLAFTEKVVGKGSRRVTPPSFEKAKIDSQIRTLRGEIKKQQNRRISDPAEKLKRNATVKEMQAEIKELSEAKTKIPKTKAKKQQTTLVPATQDYMTQADLHAAADTYNDLVAKVKMADEKVKKLGVANPVILKEADEAQRALSTFVGDLHKRGDLFNEKMFRDAIAPGNKLKSGDLPLSEFLRDKARHAGRDVELADPQVAKVLGQHGYKLISTGEDMVFLRDLEGAAALHNVGDYTKRASFFETLGLSPFINTDEAIRPLNAVGQEKEISQVANEAGLPFNGRQFREKLKNYLNEFNHGEGVQTFGPFIVHPGNESLFKRTHLYKINPSQLSPDHIVAALKLDDPLFKLDNPYEVARKFHGALLRGQAFGAEASLSMNDVRLLAQGMRISGLPAFSDWMRTYKVTTKDAIVLSAAAGGTIGAMDGEGIKGFAEGALIGGIGGTLAAKGGAKLITKAWPKTSPFAKGHDFYLTDRLHNANMAARYALSFTFDAGRYSEQALIASAKFDLPPVLRHKKYIQRKYAEDFGGDTQKAWKAATDTLDDVFGNNWMSQVDDIDRRMLQRGMLGFSPREADAAYAYMMMRSGKYTKAQVKENIMQLGRYGRGRAGMEKTANFVFFPFSFSKKLINTMGDWALNEPARALLIHEGFRRFQESQADENFGELWDKYMPLGEELKRINNLSFGLSPGRFFLQGLTDNESLLGKIGQGLASVLAPSGAATPVAQAVGGASDLAAHLFVPVVITGEDINSVGDLLTRYFPMARELSQYGRAARDQYTAINEGGEPFYQQRHYLDEKRDLKQQYEPIALSLGYASVDGFLSSDIGAPYKAEIDAQEIELRRKYPTGAKMSDEFTSAAGVDEQALLDLADNPNRSTGEEMILRIAEMEAEAKNMAASLGMSQEEILRLFTDDIRNMAIAFAGDRRFAELWDRFFGFRYGPIEMVKA